MFFVIINCFTSSAPVHRISGHEPMEHSSHPENRRDYPSMNTANQRHRLIMNLISCSAVMLFVSGVVLNVRPATAQTAQKASTPPVRILDMQELLNIDGGAIGESSIHALSTDGTTAAGVSPNSTGKPRATIWSGTDLESQDLGDPLESASGSRIRALSGDGTVAAGSAYQYTYSYHPDLMYPNRSISIAAEQAAIWWKSPGWSDAIILGTLTTDDQGKWVGQSAVEALSNDGNIAAGWAAEEMAAGGDLRTRAVIWSDDGSPGKNWKKKTDLGTLKQDNSGNSQVFALSRNDGTIAAGVSEFDNSQYSRQQHATIWSAPDWGTKTDLGTLRQDNSGNSQVRALSNDGTIAAGAAEYENFNRTLHAAIWSGSNWEKKTDLGTLRADNSGESQVYALSAGGKIAAGSSQSNNVDIRATIWSGPDWGTKTDLGTLRADNSGQSRVYALSADGTVAGGWASSTKNGRNYHRATLWHLEYSSTISTTATNSSGKPPSATNSSPPSATNSSPPSATNSSGKPSSGKPSSGKPSSGKPPSATNSSGTTPSGTTPSGTNSSGTTPSGTNSSGTTPSATTGTNLGGSSGPRVVAKIDVDATRASVAGLAGDSFIVMEQQRLALGRLQDSCKTDRAGQFCYKLKGGGTAFDGNSDLYSLVLLGYAFTGNFAAGVNLSSHFAGNLPGNIKRDGASPGAGVWARWRTATNDGHWYLRGQAAVNRADIKRTRSAAAGVEPGTGKSTGSGRGLGMEAGRIHDLSSNSSAGYYGGLRYTRVTLPGYTETRAPGFPFSWTQASSRRTSAYAGLSYSMSFGGEIRWSVNAELEQDLDYKDPTLTATAQWVGSQSFKRDYARTRGSLSSDLSYAFNDAAVLSISPFVQYTATGKTAYGAMLSISGNF